MHVGIVRALYRFPVKSMRGERIECGQLGWHGLEGDRRFAFVRSQNSSRFPWLTGRDVPALLRYVPYLTAPEQPKDSPLRVRTPAGADVAVEDDALRHELASRYGAAVHLMQLGRGAFDSMPLSLVTTAAVRQLGAWLGSDLEPERLRANVLIEPVGAEPFPEEGWLGRELAFGARADSARVRVNRRIERCVMITLDPTTAAANPAVLRTVARAHEGCAGVYCSPSRTGTIYVGDGVHLML